MIKRLAAAVVLLFLFFWFDIPGCGESRSKKEDTETGGHARSTFTFVQGTPTSIAVGGQPCLDSSTGRYNPLGSMRVAPAASGTVNSGRFGNGRNNGGKFHGGIDLAAEPGTQAYAVSGGRVVEVFSTAGTGALHSDDGGGFGNYVRIECMVDGQTVTMTYAHLSSVGVTPGQMVSAGTPIATTGRTGNAWNVPNAHLHFEVRDSKGKSINPEPFLNGGVSSSGDFVNVVCDNYRDGALDNDYALGLDK